MGKYLSGCASLLELSPLELPPSRRRLPMALFNVAAVQPSFVRERQMLLQQHTATTHCNNTLQQHTPSFVQFI